jgi:hydrogenase maturation protease
LSKRKIVILGLGNPVLTDDAAGLRVAEALEKLLEENPIPGVEVLASTRAGFELLDLLTGFDIALIVDAFLAEEPEPGKVRHLDMNDIAGNARLNAVHEISVGAAFELGKKLGIPMPGQVEIFAIEVEDIYTLSEEMTPVIQAAVIPLAMDMYERARELSETQVEGDPDDDDPKTNRAFYPPG